MIYYKSVAPERESCRNNTLISGYISDVHCIVNRINLRGEKRNVSICGRLEND